MNSTLKYINERASCRHFSEKHIGNDIKERLFEVAANAPTGGNLQAFSIISIENEESKAFLSSKSLNQGFIKQAPLCLLFCIDWNRTNRMCSLDLSPTGFEKDYINNFLGMIEMGIIAQNVVIAAESMGLRSVYIGNIAYYLSEVTEYFELPKYVIPTIALCLGYGKKEPVKHEKFPPEAIVHGEKYREISDSSLQNIFEDKYGKIKVKATESMLSKYRENCSQTYNFPYAELLTNRVREKGYIGINQYEFGIFPFLFEDNMSNSDYVDYLRKQGFSYY